MKSNHIKDIVQLVLPAHDDWHWYLIQEWQSIVGGLHTKMRLEKILGTTLVIGVYDVHWMQELHLLSGTIRRTINAQLKQDAVEKLRFMLVARRSPKPEQSAPVPHHSAPKMRMQQRHMTALGCIKNKELHDALKKYFERCMY